VYWLYLTDKFMFGAVVATVNIIIYYRKMLQMDKKLRPVASHANVFIVPNEN
jgi:hypothetical protein